MSLTRKIAHNTAIQFTGKILGTLIALVTISLMMRYLGNDGYGQYITTITYLSFIAIFFDLGLYLIVTREISKKGANEQQLISNTLTIRLVVACFVFLVAGLILYFFLPYSYITKMAILVNASAFLFMSFNQLLTGLFQKHLRMEKVSIAEVVGRLFWLLAVVIVVKLELGLLWVVGTNSIAALLNFAVLYLFARKYVKIKLAFDFKVWKYIALVTAPLAVNVIFNALYFKAGPLILTWLKSEAEVSILGGAQKILENLTTFAAIFAGLLFPIFSKYLHENKSKFKNAFQKGFDAISILILPIICGTLFLGERLIVLVGGEDFAASGGVLRVLIFAVGAIFFSNLFGNVVVAANLQKKLIPVYILNFILAIGISLIFIPKYSYYGAAASTLVTEIIMFIAPAVLVYKYLKVKPSLNVFSRSLLATGAMALVLLLIPSSLNLSIPLIAALLTYLVALYLFKGISKEIIVEIISLKKM
ncbi:flippase [Patescibacteria group bacterium]|nr:flippase [Patescibacteria group bacterium]